MDKLEQAQLKRQRKASKKNPSKYATWNLTEEANEHRKRWNLLNDRFVSEVAKTNDLKPEDLVEDLLEQQETKVEAQEEDDGSQDEV